MTHRNTVDDGQDFTEFIRRIRAGDAAAAVELVREFEPLIRREVRLHLEDRRLKRLFDSLDICQSVLASFFIRTAAGQYNLESQSQLVNLLVTMARNKLASAARLHYRERRDTRRQSNRERDTMARTIGPEADPGEIVAGRDLLDRFRRCLNDEERQLAEWRSDGVSWTEIAVRLGGTPDARRLQLSRAVDRAARELGLDE